MSHRDELVEVALDVEREATDEGPGRVARARARALRTARAVTLGLALGASAPGCEVTANLYCDVFTSTRYCCERTGYSAWDETTHTCVVRAVPGPIVAPPS